MCFLARAAVGAGQNGDVISVVDGLRDLPDWEVAGTLESMR
jgi:hypothetical protein